MSPAVEQALAQHCAPVLMGCKAANLFSCAGQPAILPACAAQLAARSIAIRLLGGNNGRSLVFVYRPLQLETALCHPLAKAQLGKLGYPVTAGLEEMLGFLQRRLEEQQGFPHEIGFFLGYPAADVVGFIHYRGRHCKHCGLWKVYSNVERAKALFKEYETCRCELLRYLAKGGSIYDMYAAQVAG